MANTFDITYRFVFEDATAREFTIQLDRHTLRMVNVAESPHPDWTRLEFHQCPNCPLTPDKEPYCPVALSLYKPIVLFKDFLSYEEAHVHVQTEVRQYVKHTPLHLALSSMVGIYMVTSGCPVLEMLRPMVRFHLPFADEDETSYRAISMYLMAQFLVMKEGGTPDWELKGLSGIYDEIMKVNKGFVTRMQNMPIKDASLNAVITLDCFAMNITFAISQDMMDEMRDNFHMYLKK